MSTPVQNNPDMKLRGLGLVFHGGRGQHALEERVAGPWLPPTPLAIPEREATVPAYAIPADVLVDKEALKGMRRADRFCRLATLAAWDAWQDAGLHDTSDDVRARTGIILGTALGPHVTTFRFLDGILDYGDTDVSPTAFSHSVHNAAASYIAARLGLRGPALTVTDFHFSFPYALLQARAWLAEGRCDRILVGSTDELGTVMGAIAGHKMHVPGDGRLRPEDFADRPAAVPAEAAVFFVVDSAPDPCALGCIESMTVPQAESDQPHADRVLYDANGLLASEAPYRAWLHAIGATHPHCYADRFGSVPSGLSLHVATAALALKRESAPARVACLKLNGRGQRASLILAKV